MAKRQTVMMVDDDQTILSIATDLLQGAGFAVQPAQDLVTMSVWLERGGFDIILLDQMMPDLMGQDLVPYLKEGLKLRVPIVLCSALEPNKVQRIVEQCGADGMIRIDTGLKHFVGSVRAFLK